MAVRSASTVYGKNGVGASGEVVQAGNGQRVSRQIQSSKTESRSCYRGRDQESWSGAKGKLGTRRSAHKGVLESSARCDNYVVESECGGAG